MTILLNTGGFCARKIVPLTYKGDEGGLYNHIKTIVQISPRINFLQVAQKRKRTEISFSIYKKM